MKKDPEQEGRIILKVTADFILTSNQLQHEELIKNKENIQEKVQEWLEKEAAVRGWNIKKLNHYYKLTYEQYTSVKIGSVSTSIRCVLKGRGGRKPKNTEQ